MERKVKILREKMGGVQKKGRRDSRVTPFKRFY